MHMMGLPVIETSVRGFQKKDQKMFAMLWRKGDWIEYCMKSKKCQEAFYHIIKQMAGITPLTALIHLSAMGAFRGDE